MNIQLVKLTPEYRPQLEEMMGEWLAAEQNFSPYAIRKNDYHDFDNYLAHLECTGEEPGRVPDSVFFCLDLDRNIFVGAVNIRHYLNEYLLQFGGHIGDGIRPSERRKGYATAMIRLALEEGRKLGIELSGGGCGHPGGKNPTGSAGRNRRWSKAEFAPNQSSSAAPKRRSRPSLHFPERRRCS